MTPVHAGLVGYNALLWLAGLFCLWRIPRCPVAGSFPPRKRVSVIVPARNEATRIRPLLESLRHQVRETDEVLVVDDGSTDGTADVARSLGATVLEAPPRPDGWHGKTWACWTGAQRATGEVLVFLDADTYLEPGGLEALLAVLAGRGGLMSVQPYHVVSRLHEQLSAFHNIVVMSGVGAFTPLGSRFPAGGSFGPCLLASREVYFRLGGHSEVRGQVVEDQALGDRARSLGLPVTCLGGNGTIRFRMYESGLRAQVEGWTKNMATGAAASPAPVRAMVSAWLIGATSAVLCLALGLAPGDTAFGVAAVVGYVLYAAQVAWMLRRIGSFSLLTALFFPVSLAFFHAVFARSVWITAFRRAVTWRGKSIPVGRR